MQTRGSLGRRSEYAAGQLIRAKYGQIRCKTDLEFIKGFKNNSNPGPVGSKTLLVAVTAISQQYSAKAGCHMMQADSSCPKIDSCE